MKIKSTDGKGKKQHARVKRTDNGKNNDVAKHFATGV